MSAGELAGCVVSLAAGVFVVLCVGLALLALGAHSAAFAFLVVALLGAMLLVVSAVMVGGREL